MNRLLFAVALSTLAIAACSQKQEAAPPAMPAPAALAPAPAAPVAEAPAVATVDTTKPADGVAPVAGEPKLQAK